MMVRTGSAYGLPDRVALTGAQHKALIVLLSAAVYNDRYAERAIRCRLSRETDGTRPWCVSVNSATASRLEQMGLVRTYVRAGLLGYTYAEPSERGASVLHHDPAAKGLVDATVGEFVRRQEQSDAEYASRR